MGSHLPPACTQWASALLGTKGLLVFVTMGPCSILFAQETREKPMTGDVQGDVLSCRARVCIHVPWQASLFDFLTSHTSFRRRLAWSQALAALSSLWSEVILPLYTANQCRNKKTQLLQGGRVLRGKKHGYWESQNNQFIQDFSPVPCHWELDSPHPVL